MGIAGTIEDFLRGRRLHAIGGGKLPIGALVALTVGGGFVYGAMMGSFNGRPLQMLYSAIKVPLLLLVATLVSLPNFYVVNSIMGLRDDFLAACRGIFAAQAVLSVTLAALSPWPALIYLSTRDYTFALQFNGIPFLLATLAAQVVLTRHYRPLIAKDPRHRLPLRLWLFFYSLVAIQSAWVLRPYIGTPNLPTHFFREDAWRSNGFVKIAQDLAELLS